MYKHKLCLGTSSEFGTSLEEQLRLFKKIGFDGFFTGWKGDIKEKRRLAEKLDLIYQSVHAPIGNSANMWKTDESAENAVGELLACLKDCGEYQVPILVVHTYIGFGPNPGPNQAGIENFRRVVEEAAKQNVKIAFENTEGEEYLAALMEAFRGYKNVGFCWDTGHELCYNKGKDMMALYGDRLFCTHLNDNLGIRDFQGEITYFDDLHLLPFDGITNWQSVADRLDRWGYDDILTFELTTLSKPGRRDNEKYVRMGVENYLAEAYARASRVAALRK